MDLLSARITSLPVSATLAMAAKARELKNQGIDVIGLSLGGTRLQYSRVYKRGCHSSRRRQLEFVLPCRWLRRFKNCDLYQIQKR